MLSGAVDSAGGITVSGTGGDDVITVGFQNNQLTVDVNGQTSDFPMTPTTTLEVDGLAGNDTLASDNSVPGNFGVLFRGGDGDDQINGGWGADTLFGDDGNDTLLGGQGVDTVDGGYGSDVMSGGNQGDTVVAEEPRTQMYLAFADGLPDSGAPGEHDTIESDFNSLGDGTNTINGTHNGDHITLSYFAGELIVKVNGKASYYPDESEAPLGVQINGMGGNDTVQIDDSVSRAASAFVNGGSGDDSLVGGDDQDRLNGGDGNDTIQGGDGDDACSTAGPGPM